MNQWFGYIIAVIAISGLIYNEFYDERVEVQFFDDMRFHHNKEAQLVGTLIDFVKKGPRNTAYQGYDLCKRVEKLEQLEETEHEVNLTSTECEEIYGVEEE